MSIHKLPVPKRILDRWAVSPDLLTVACYTFDVLSATSSRAMAIQCGDYWERFKKLLAQFDMLGDEMGEEIETFCEELEQGEYIPRVPALGKYWPSSWDEPGHFEYQDDKLKAAMEECRDALLLLIYEGYDE